MIKVTIEKTFSKTPEDARKCLCTLTSIEGAILSTAQIVERLDDSGSKTIRIQIEGKARMVFDQIREALQGSDDFDFRDFAPSNIGNRIRIGKSAYCPPCIFEGREGIIASVIGRASAEVLFDLGYHKLTELFPPNRIEFIPPHELQIGDVIRILYPDNFSSDLLSAHMLRQGDLAIITGFYTTDANDNCAILKQNDIEDKCSIEHLIYIRSSRLCVGDRIWVKDEMIKEDSSVKSRDHEIIDFNRSEDNVEIVILDLGKEVPISKCSLNLEAFALRVTEQEKLIFAAQKRATAQRLSSLRIGFQL